jgi:peptidoglycan hydrolase-like protein with peptidoglycan-binding domain
VIAWQEKYATDILVPQHMTKGTGIVGAKSLQKIKQQALVQCPQSGIDKSSAIRTTHTALVRDLKVGMSGADVRTLQQALITKMVGPLARALAAHKPTGYFGSLTKRALVEFQTSVGIAPATGGYGSKTRAVLKI